MNQPGTQLYLSGNHEFVPRILLPVTNSEDFGFLKKPKGGTGLWTSTWREETQDSAWIEWCLGADFGEPYKQSWHLLTPSRTTHLYIIDGVADLHALLVRYSWETERSRDLNARWQTHIAHSPYLQLGEAGYAPPELKGKLYCSIDFERLVNEYDGIWLTERGNAATHLSWPQDLNSWDAESILWFRWCFTDWRSYPVPPQPQESEVEP